ncbi:MAG: DUF4422 domain-containing protein [Desulfovibrio sp.]|nr:DUF4422 domain-containing protein [Desulfovibrio sp.]
MDIKVMVAAHKPYWMPSDGVYLPVQVGAAGKESIDAAWQRDDEGQNISHLNPYYCELTALYWAWKNLEADYIGLCHYRRYFGRSIFRGSLEQKRGAIFSRADYERLLAETDVIVPKKRNYYIETVYSQYAHAHRASDLEDIKGIIEQRCPEYLPAWDKVMHGRRVHILNMFVMNKENFRAYCEWLFPIIDEFASHFDLADPYASRLFGFPAERLFNVWLEKQGLREAEVPIVMLEPVNWLKKGGAFLRRKFGV